MAEVDVLTDLETVVLEKATSGDEPLLVDLRRQLASLKVSRRQVSGLGFFTEFVVEGSVEPVSDLRDFAISDISATLSGLDHGVGFNVFVRRGYVAILEGFTFDGPWPTDIRGLEVTVPAPRATLSFAGDVGP